eukprot:SAG11_NODE_9_length_28972_cov_81.532539_7_plen_624_part_00
MGRRKNRGRQAIQISEEVLEVHDAAKFPCAKRRRDNQGKHLPAYQPATAPADGNGAAAMLDFDGTPKSIEAFLHRHDITVMPRRSVIKGLDRPIATFDLASKTFGNVLVEPMRRVIDAGAQPTPIQAVCWGALHLSNPSTPRKLLGVAETGSGKTFAFLMPAAERIIHAANAAGRAQWTVRDLSGPTCLVVVPTRELAQQIHRQLRMLLDPIQRGAGAEGELRSALVLGGQEVSADPALLATLFRGVEAIVATPGRLLNLLQRKKVHLRRLLVLVLDEADRMLSMGFEEPLRAIAGYIPLSVKAAEAAEEAAAAAAVMCEESKTLFVGGLPWAVTEEQIRTAFADCGTIETIKLAKDLVTGRFRGFGHATFGAPNEARAAQALGAAGLKIGGRAVKVDLTEPRDGAMRRVGLAATAADTWLFTATWAPEVERFASELLGKDALRITVARAAGRGEAEGAVKGMTEDNSLAVARSVTQRVEILKIYKKGKRDKNKNSRQDEQKMELLMALLHEHGHGRDANGRKLKSGVTRAKVLVFVNTKARCEELGGAVIHRIKFRIWVSLAPPRVSIEMRSGFACANRCLCLVGLALQRFSSVAADRLHGGRSMQQRERALADFGACCALV